MRFIISTILFIGVFGLIALKYRGKVAVLIRSNVHLPRIILSYMTFIPIAIVEENLNCPVTGCFSFPGLLFPYTVWYFLILFSFDLLLLKLFKIKNFFLALSIFGIIGIFIEFTPLGGYYGMIWSLPWYIIIFLSLWTFLTYAAMVIIPTEILMEADLS